MDEDAYSDVIRKFEQVMQDEGSGTVHGIDEWGVRALAYEIDGHDRGYYVLMTFEMDSAGLRNLEERFKLDDRVVRHQFVRLEEAVPSPSAGSSGQR